MEFNDRLYQLRRQQGFSQEELANRLDVSRQTISKWEAGDSKPDMDKLIALGELYGISLDELVKGEKPAAPDRPVVVERSGFDEINKRLDKIIKAIFTERNKAFFKKVLKIMLIVLLCVLAFDILFFIIYVCINGMPGLDENLNLFINGK